MVAANDYAAAARLQEEMDKGIAHEMTEARLPSASGQDATLKPRRRTWALAELWPRVAGPSAKRSTRH